jgi:hypothetical protein
MRFTQGIKGHARAASSAGNEKSPAVMPAKAGIQYAAASRFIATASGILDHPPQRAIAHKADDDTVFVARDVSVFFARSDHRLTPP